MVLILYAVITAAVVFLDLFTKYLVKGSELLMSGGSIEVIPGVFRLRYVENPGAAMGSFANNRWVFMIFSSVAIVVIGIYLVKKRREIPRFLGIALSLIVGGGIGNMYERLFNLRGGRYVVTDFFDFYLFDFWVWIFNVADVAVCVGAGLVVLYLIMELVREYRYKKNPAAHDELVALDALESDNESVSELWLLDGEEPGFSEAFDETEGFASSEGEDDEDIAELLASEGLEDECEEGKDEIDEDELSSRGV